MLGVARTFREKKLPCDALIFLGTGFAPAGWNTNNGEFTWNPKTFPDPKRMIEELHAEHFKVVLHVVLEGHELVGTVDDPSPESARAGRHRDRAARGRDRQLVACYWPTHTPLFDIGVDGWWPDQGDGLDAPSRLARIRMYWDGSQRERPGERLFALHRNGYAGMQRYAAFLWSGDVYSTWETLRTHVPVAINTGLSGVPYWGTDIGGFVPTREYTGELHVRWFQFGAFCPLFRAHGRDWHLRLPWGWNTGELGPERDRELRGRRREPGPERAAQRRGRAHLPRVSRAALPPHAVPLHGRARGLRHRPAGDARALAAPRRRSVGRRPRRRVPVGRATSWWRRSPSPGRRPGGCICRAEGGTTSGPSSPSTAGARSCATWTSRPCRSTCGPARCCRSAPSSSTTGEPTDEPITLVVFPGADGVSRMYEDDGHTFGYRTGDWMMVEMAWEDGARRLTLRLAEGSRMRPPLARRFAVRLAGATATRTVTFDGRPISLRL